LICGAKPPHWEAGGRVAKGDVAVVVVVLAGWAEVRRAKLARVKGRRCILVVLACRSLKLTMKRWQAASGVGDGDKYLFESHLILD
jgi:hypothetical protein